MRPPRSRQLAYVGASLVAVASVAALAYLQRAFPYNGLYGVDAYAYAGQSDALLRDLTGRPQRPGALFGSDGLPHWPIGYHLHLVLGRGLTGGSIEGGRVLTLAMAAGVPVLAYLLVLRLAGFLTVPARVAAGVVAGGALLLAATFTRMGTSLMSDVPAMFWVLAACVLAVWGWPPPRQRLPPGPRFIWAAAAGAALGMSVFVRYASVLLAIPLMLYLLLRYGELAMRRPFDYRSVVLPALAAVVAFLVVLVPQAIYLLTHEAGPESGSYFASMNIGNMLSRSSTGPDGQAVFPRTMLEFYTLSPLWDAPGGFLPGAFLPLALLGLLVLVIRKRWVELGLLLAWWLLPALAYATTPYQTHRYALLYLPAITALVGIGAAAGVEGAVLALRRRSVRRAVASLLVLIPVAALLGYGGVQGWRSVRDWQATHAAWQAADEALARDVTLPQGTTGTSGTADRAVCFGASAPLDFYAGLAVLDLYNNDEKALAAFIRPGATIAVVPEKSLQTQWAGEPVAQRWEWLKATYNLVPVGSRGEYSIYRVNSR